LLTAPRPNLSDRAELVSEAGHGSESYKAEQRSIPQRSSQ
jgi:hypothetical protein